MTEDQTPYTDTESKSPKAAQDNVNENATATAYQNRANANEAEREGQPDPYLASPNQGQNEAPNLSRTPEHPTGENEDFASNPSVTAAAAAAAPATPTGYDPTTDSQVAARVNTGRTGLAKGVGIAVGQLPANTVREAALAVKGSLSFVKDEIFQTLNGVEGVTNADVDRLVAAVDAADTNLTGLVGLAGQAESQAHTEASQS